MRYLRACYAVRLRSASLVHGDEKLMRSCTTPTIPDGVAFTTAEYISRYLFPIMPGSHVDLRCSKNILPSSTTLSGWPNHCSKASARATGSPNGIPFVKRAPWGGMRSNRSRNCGQKRWAAHPSGLKRYDSLTFGFANENRKKTLANNSAHVGREASKVNEI